MSTGAKRRLAAKTNGAAATTKGAVARTNGRVADANRHGSFEAQAEVLKLAQLMHRDPETLAYLGGLPLEDLRALREQTTDVLFSSNQKTLLRLAAAAKLLPAGVIATIAQRAFGPVLAAQIAGLLEPSRAVDVASKLPPEFVADIAAELDPRRATDVIAKIPPEQVAAVTKVLVSRDQFVTMGRFVGHLSDPAIGAALAAMDDATLLQVGFVLENKRRLDHVVGMLPSERLNGLIDAAADGELWLETLDVLSHLGEQRQCELAELAIAKGDAVLESLVQAAEEHGMWDAVVRMESTIGDQSREQFVAFVKQHHPELTDRLGS